MNRREFLKRGSTLGTATRFAPLAQAAATATLKAGFAERDIEPQGASQVELVGEVGTMW